MVDVQTSSIREWLTFNGTLQDGPKPCLKYVGTTESPPLIEVSCSQVCNDSRWLFSSINQTSNLVTCGQWSSLMNGWIDGESSSNLALDVTPTLQSFDAVGLNASDTVFISNPIDETIQPAITTDTAVGRHTIYADLISTCLLEIYQLSKSTSSIPDPGSVPAACTRSRLFVNQFSQGQVSTIERLVEPMTSSLTSCLNAICSQGSLNTELVGVGVRFNFAMLV